MGALDRVRRGLLLERGEGGAVASGALASALVLLAYGLLKPARDAIFAAEGQGGELLWTGTFLGAVLLQPLWATLADRLSPRALLAWALRGSALALLLGGVLLEVGGASGAPGVLHELQGSWWEGRWIQREEGWALEAGPRVWAERAFYVGLSVGNLLLVSIVWAALSRRFQRLQARRVFGLIAAGASVGSLLGAGVVTLGDGRLSGVALAATGALCLEGALWALRRAGAEGQAPRGGALRGLGLVLRVPRLRGLAAYVLLFTLGSTWLYFLTGRLVGEQLEQASDRVVFFARMQAATSAVTLFAQLLLSGRSMAGLGLGGTLALLPALSIAGLGALAFAPALGTVLAVNVLMAAARYAFARPAREALLAGGSEAELFQAKAALDTAIYRGGDVASAWAFSAMAALATGVPLTLSAVPVLGLGVALGLYLGRSAERGASSS
jgi:AAA family ATP:ADP antiporter